MIKKISYISLIFLILFIFFYIVSNSTNYFDPINACYIKIQGDVLKGDESTVRKALTYVRSTDRNKYITVCKYVNKIVENTCLTSDPHFGYPENIPDACFIKGSRTIYLAPSEDTSVRTVTKRALDIVNMSEKSKEFWK